MSLRRKSFEEFIPMVDQIDPSVFHCQVRELLRHGHVDHIGQRSRDLCACSSSTHNHEIQRTLFQQLRVLAGILENGKDARAQPLSLFDAVEWICVLVRTFCAEKICLRSSRQHQEVSLVALAVLGGHSPSFGIDSSNHCHFHVDIGMAAESLTNGSRHIASTHLPRRQLVQQGLELLVVVLVNEGDADVTLLGQFSRTSQAGKAATYNHNVRFRTVTTHCGPPGELAYSAAVSRPSFWWQQVRSAERSKP